MMDIEKIKKKLFAEQRGLGGCDLFTGNEDLGGMIRLYDSFQGRTFCRKTHWPSLEEVRRLKSFDLKSHGVYLDEGDVELFEHDKIIIAGDTHATLHYNTPKPHSVNVQYGATVEVHASGYAVVDIYAADGCTVKEYVGESAIITHSNKPKR